jgi:hypothetical protein
MCDGMIDQYEEYLQDFQAWGHQFCEKPLSYDAFEELKVEQEDLDIAEECGRLSKKERKRSDEIQRLLLTHESYFADGPRVTLTISKER